MIKKRKRRAYKRRRRPSGANQAMRVIGDVATLAVGAAVVTHVTTATVNALKK